MKKFLFGGISALALAFATFAIAQSVQPTFLTNINGNTDAIQDVPGGNGSAQSQYVHPNAITTTYGYVKQSQAETSSALTVTATNNMSYLLLTGSALSSGTVTINFPPTPNDGAKFCLRSIAGVTSGATIAYGPSTATFTTTPTSFTAATTYCYLYSASNTTWDVI